MEGVSEASDRLIHMRKKAVKRLQSILFQRFIIFKWR